MLSDLRTTWAKQQGEVTGATKLAGQRRVKQELSGMGRQQQGPRTGAFAPASPSNRISLNRLCTAQSQRPSRPLRRSPPKAFPPPPVPPGGL